MNDITIAEFETFMTTGYPDCAGMTNDDLIFTVMCNDDATEIEQELAQRLYFAECEINDLHKELNGTGQVQH